MTNIRKDLQASLNELVQLINELPKAYDVHQSDIDKLRNVATRVKPLTEDTDSDDGEVEIPSGDPASTDYADNSGFGIVPEGETVEGKLEAE